MDYKFAYRIRASIEPEGHEIDAVTYKQFLAWDEKEKSQYLRDHPLSKFGRQHEQGLTETKPYSQIRRERNQALHQQRSEPSPVSDGPNSGGGTYVKHQPSGTPVEHQAPPHEYKEEQKSGDLQVTDRKRVKDPIEGTRTEITLSDGSKASISKVAAISSGGVGGWHDNDAPSDYSYLADTEEEAIKELIRRRQAKAQKQERKEAQDSQSQTTSPAIPKEEPKPAEPKGDSELVPFKEAQDQIRKLKGEGWSSSGAAGAMVFTNPASGETISFKVDPKANFGGDTQPLVQVTKVKSEPKAPKPTPVVRPEPEAQGATPLQNPLESGNGNLESFKKELRKPKTTYRAGQWEKKQDRWTTPEGDTLLFYATTTYSKEGRLRVPGKTKYQVFMQMNVPNPQVPGQQNWVTVPFSVSTGENSESEEKMQEGRRKAREFAKKKFNIDLGQFDFKH